MTSMWRYRDLLPFDPLIPPVSIGEGLTPVIQSRLFPDLRLFWKDETRNPTGSHKDRPLSLAATDARSRGARAMVVVSAGSTGLSNATYAARGGMRGIAVMAEGAPADRVYPLHALGSRLISVSGAGIDELIEAVTSLHGINGLYVASTTRAANPVQAEASRTIAYELVDQLGGPPDILVVPVGGGGTIAGIHRGFVQLRELGRIDRLPRLVAVVPERYDTLLTAFRQGISRADALRRLPAPAGGPTVLNKIAHGHPPDGAEALLALHESNGAVHAFDDGDAIGSVLEIGAVDGLYFEPSTAIVLPALRQMQASGFLKPGQTIVALGCGSGFRETSVMRDALPLRVETVAFGGLRQALGG